MHDDIKEHKLAMEGMNEATAMFPTAKHPLLKSVEMPPYLV